MQVEQHENHRWLMQLLGDWDFESEASMGPGEPPCKASGRESVSALGGIWVIGEGEGEMPGVGTGRTRLTIGYDMQRERFVGSWVGSMMTNQWVYEGQLDSARRVLTLETEGPNCMDETQGQLGRYRDVIELLGPDERTLRSMQQGEDGQWQEIMLARYKRRA